MCIRDRDKGVRKNPGRNNLLIKEKTLTNVGVFFHMPGLPIRTGYSGWAENIF